MNNTILPFIKPKKPITEMTNEELAIEAERLEILADTYSRTDWDAMQRVVGELHTLDSLLLDRYNEENEQWLQKHNI